MTRPARLALALVAAFGAASVSACDKPTPEDCEKALRNMQQLLGTDNLNTTAGIQSEIRRCRGGSSRTAVACAIKAQSLDELNKCDFERTGTHGSLGSGSAGSGSAASAAGSAGAGSAGAGSAAAGSAGAGSAGAGSTGAGSTGAGSTGAGSGGAGSAGAGSATAGSAAAGSAK
ncbi:MAG: hypothetical protein ABI591_24025 [Kofleriaceae bacterium]